MKTKTNKSKAKAPAGSLARRVRGSRKWCKHIKWQPFEREWWVLLGWLHVEDSWKLCPLCGEKRPNEKAERPERE